MQRRVEQPDRDRLALHRLEQALEVLLLQRQQLGERARARASSSSAMITRRIFGWWSSPRNTCSVRQQADPLGAELAALARASSGVSALARTPSRRSSSHQLEHRLEAARPPARRRAARRRRVTSPVVPSIAIRSPARSIVSPTRTVSARRGRSRARTRRTRTGRPIPRATSAACEALPPSRGEDPPRGVEAGDVVGLGERPHEDDVAARRCRLDRLRGGEDDLALRRARRRAHAAREHGVLGVAGRTSGAAARRGRRRRSSAAPRSRVSRPSSTASTAKRTAACAGRFALRVCSMYSRPSSTVNSVSCMSP